MKVIKPSVEIMDVFDGLDVLKGKNIRQEELIASLKAEIGRCTK